MKYLLDTDHLSILQRQCAVKQPTKLTYQPTGIIVSSGIVPRIAQFCVA